LTAISSEPTIDQWLRQRAEWRELSEKQKQIVNGEK